MQKGFTLIEVLIVMVIISIVGSLTILMIRVNQNTRIETLTKQLTHLIILAEEQAMLEPATLGLKFSEHSFQFYQFLNNNWQVLLDNTLTLHKLPDDINLTLESNYSTQPEIVISPGGDITPFRLSVGKLNEKPRYRIIGQANGNVFYETI